MILLLHEHECNMILLLHEHECNMILVRPLAILNYYDTKLHKLLHIQSTIILSHP